MSFKKMFVGLAASALLVASGTASVQKTQFVSVLTGGQSGVY